MLYLFKIYLNKPIILLKNLTFDIVKIDLVL